MNRISVIAKQYRILVCLVMLLPIFSIDLDASRIITEKDIENRVINMNSAIELRYNSEVQKRIDQYTVKQKGAASVLLGRVSVYFPLFENILREKGLPDDLKYLAVVESGLSPHATSSMGAAGLWQFMKPTARMHGLKVNGVIDERRDPIKSTYAAAEYLEYLYNRFGDWTMAIAAYNCGPGNVSKAIKRSGGKTTYWEIQKYLPRETRGYIPKFIAFNYMMNYYYDHDIVPGTVDNNLIYTASVKVFDQVNLKSISKEMDLDYKIIKLLNPSYVRGYIPSNDGKYVLTLPETEMHDYALSNNLELFYQNGVSRNEVIVEVEVEEVVKRRVLENPPNISASITESKARLVEYNSELQEIRSYQMINLKPYKLHVIKKRESLADIAERENLNISEIIEMNNITKSNPPKMGDVIKLRIL